MENDKIHDSERPAHGQQVITACAFIYYDFNGIAKVFLPKRAETKKFLPGRTHRLWRRYHRWFKAGVERRI